MPLTQIYCHHCSCQEYMLLFEITFQPTSASWTCLLPPVISNTSSTKSLFPHMVHIQIAFLLSAMLCVFHRRKGKPTEGDLSNCHPWACVAIAWTFISNAMSGSHSRDSHLIGLWCTFHFKVLKSP